jgi:PPOX class probable F420-dependent enzyme
MRSVRSRLAVFLVLGSVVCGGIWVGSVGAKSKAPQRPPMSQDKINAFLNGKHNAILATIKKDGSPQLTPMIYRWDGEQFWISTTKDRAKYSNIMRDPRISLCIDDAATTTTVIATGKARITEENLWADTLKIVERYRGPEQAAAYVKSMQDKKEPRIILILKPEKVISWGQ